MYTLLSPYVKLSLEEAKVILFRLDQGLTYTRRTQPLWISLLSIVDLVCATFSVVYWFTSILTQKGSSRLGQAVPFFSLLALVKIVINYQLASVNGLEKRKLMPYLQSYLKFGLPLLALPILQYLLKLTRPHSGQNVRRRGQREKTEPARRAR